MNKLIIQQFPQIGYACAEAVNALCTNLSFAGEGVKRIMLTSSHASEGKSFLAMNVMRTMAKLGKTVALVDADLRRSVVDTRFKLKYDSPKKDGLAQYLAGMAEMEDVIYETDVPGAWMVPVGRTVSNSLPLLNSPRFSALLDFLAANVDYVLVDAAPVGLVIDAVEISRSCDGTVLVVGYNSTSRRELMDARDLLMQTDCPILGTVLNMVEYDNYLSKKYYYKSYYSKSYYHYEADDKDAGKKKKEG